MCGVNGILYWDRAREFSGNIRNMNDILKHRGPDDEGVYEDQNILLGHRRLSIVDLSSLGRQPMSDSRQTVWISCNGEIYNYPELKKELDSNRFNFKSASDNEVIIHGFKQWQTGIFEKLEGMFAFALWDKDRQELFLVRDGCGVKPLFYYFDGEKLIFSSEIKGILRSELAERTVNLQGLSDFLSLCYVPGPNTILKNVYQVPPGTYIKFSKGKDPQSVKYWDPKNFVAHKLNPLSQEELNEQIREEVGYAVENSLMSDIPIGVLLSSGIDSSIILSELKKRNRKEIETVTIGFMEPSYDESQIANRFSKELGFNNHTFYMPKEDISSTLDHLVYHLDALNANPCILAEYFNFKKVSELYHVTLMGNGNDEIFAGYSTHVANKIRGIYEFLPLPLRKAIYGITQRLPVGEKKYSLDYLAKKFAEGSLYPREKSHYWWRSMFTREEKKALFKRDILKEAEINLDAFYNYKIFNDQVKDIMTFDEQTLYTDFNLFLIDNGNMEVDQLSMTFSVEARPPFLTKRFVEFAFRIPFHLKLNWLRTKHCLRRAYKGVLPDYIIKRKKQGLVSPLHFLFETENQEWLHEMLLSDSMMELFDPVYIQNLIREQTLKIRNRTYPLFCLLCFSIWKKKFIDTPLV